MYISLIIKINIYIFKNYYKKFIKNIFKTIYIKNQYYCYFSMSINIKKFSISFSYINVYMHFLYYYKHLLKLKIIEK